MMTEEKKIEYWNYLTAEKNSARPRGITAQRLALIKPVVLASAIWFDVIVRYGAERCAAKEFYQSQSAAAVHSRANFWGEVSRMVKDSIAAGGRQRSFGRVRKP